MDFVGIDEIAPLTEEQWERIISWHRQRGKWAHVQAMQTAKQFTDTMNKLMATAGTAERSLEAISKGIADMAKGEQE